MGRLHSIGKVSIRVYANDHLPPHVHIVGTDREALIEIATLRVLRGTVPDRAALAWCVRHLDVVKSEWTRLNPRYPAA